MKKLMGAFVDACPVIQTGRHPDGKEIIGYYHENIEEFLRNKYVINQDDLIRVFSTQKGSWTDRLPNAGGYIQSMKAKAQGYLIASSIESVQKPTPESILLELIRKGDQIGASWPNEVCDLYKQAKALMEKLCERCGKESGNATFCSSDCYFADMMADTKEKK